MLWAAGTNTLQLSGNSMCLISSENAWRSRAIPAIRSPGSVLQEKAVWGEHDAWLRWNALLSRRSGQDHSLLHIFLFCNCSAYFFIYFSHFSEELPLSPFLSNVSSFFLLYSYFFWEGKWDLYAISLFFCINLFFCLFFFPVSVSYMKSPVTA